MIAPSLPFTDSTIVSFERGSIRPVLFVAITAVHGALFYGLANLGPHLKVPQMAEAVSVRFIGEAQPQLPPPPPQPRIIPVELPRPTEIPDLPVIEIPVAASSQRAITVPVQATPQPVVAEDRNIPKRISTVEYLREPSPQYPSQSRRLREQGLVVLRVVIDERGNACEIEVENSSGFARLDNAAREAVRRAAFRPYVEDGAPRRALVLIPIEFALNRGSA